MSIRSVVLELQGLASEGTAVYVLYRTVWWNIRTVNWLWIRGLSLVSQIELAQLFVPQRVCSLNRNRTRATAVRAPDPNR